MLVRKYNNALIICACLLSVFSCSRNDEVVVDVLYPLTADTNFTLKSPDYPTSKIILKGKLGKFAKCLKGYKSIAHRKTSKQDKTILRQELWVSDFSFIDIRSLEDEVFFFSIKIVKHGNKKAKFSASYAVNCDLSLLETTNK